MQKTDLFRVRKRNARTGGIAWLPATGTGVILLLLTITVVSYLIHKQGLNLDRAKIIIKAIFGIDVFLCSFLAAKRGHKAKLIQAILSGVLLLGLIFVLSLIDREGEGLSPAILWVTGCSCLLGGIIGAREKRSGYT